ncbi:VOC family protein [Methylobacterium nodulans]|uniref:Glyoxalase/bleomycin resistance protein/dioxygenase n=1 Tax=Methylobacterium nodulans (strain LMG 21967 / CNCM I-2342 / ORS 2060) TaxID=460265 RepID=B8IV90_METNO|nr:VOC family protein [Methylobacterium nodulans]ACL60941.1 Glyoxalase/bleomycin resistance protein/dioxygenase [Methylobacterium nodulans ORS 2060]
MDPVVHFEMPYEDRDRMVQFYESAFGWKAQKLGPEMGNYVIVTTANADVKPDAPRGSIDGGFWEKRADWPAQVPAIVIGVGDIRGTMEKILRAGGKILGDPMQIPGVGEYVSFLDTEGNRASLLQPSM